MTNFHNFALFIHRLTLKDFKSRNPPLANQNSNLVTLNLKTKL